MSPPSSTTPAANERNWEAAAAPVSFKQTPVFFGRPPKAAAQPVTRSHSQHWQKPEQNLSETESVCTPDEQGTYFKDSSDVSGSRTQQNSTPLYRHTWPHHCAFRSFQQLRSPPTPTGCPMFSSPDYGLQPSNQQREPEPPSESSLRTLTVSPHQGPPLNSVQKTQLARPVIIPGVHSTEGLRANVRLLAARTTDAIYPAVLRRRHLKSSLLVLTGCTIWGHPAQHHSTHFT